MELFLFVLGVCIGSFLNVLIDRLPKGKTLWGRSKCDWCKKMLRWYELIPLVSWVLQGARCRRCHKPLSHQYPLVEFATGVGFVLIYTYFAYLSLQLIAYLVIFSTLLVIFVADLKYQIIPDSMVILGIVGAIGGFRENIGVAVGASLFFYILWLVTKGRGMGFGDVKLAFLLGLLLGFPRIVIALYGAFLTGAVLGVILILGKRKGLKSKIAFGPFLIFGTVIAALWGEKILLLWKGAI